MDGCMDRGMHFVCILRNWALSIGLYVLEKCIKLLLIQRFSGHKSNNAMLFRWFLIRLHAVFDFVILFSCSFRFCFGFCICFLFFMFYSVSFFFFFSFLSVDAFHFGYLPFSFVLPLISPFVERTLARATAWCNAKSFKCLKNRNLFYVTYIIMYMLCFSQHDESYVHVLHMKRML